MSKKLLLADDSITIQKVIQITFAHEDYELTITDNGDAALTKAQEIKPDLVMSDIYMPGKNGYELTAAIKQDPALQHIPVLLLAGSFEPFDEEKARSCKADAWIEKPFESQNLIDKVAELLSSVSASAAPEAAFEETSAASSEELPPIDFDEEESVTAEMAEAPESAEVMDDPFGDISFAEEVPTAQAETVAAADDWSDVAAEAVEPSTDTQEAFAATEDLAVETPVVEAEEDFSFVEEVTESPEPDELEDVPVAEPELDVFAMDEDDIMPLDDADILGTEDLVPPMPEQTLAAWSRADTDNDNDDTEDPFADTVEETFPPAAAFAEETQVAAVEETGEFSADEPLVDTESTFEPSSEEPEFIDEPAVDVAPVEEPAEPFEPAPVAVAATSAVDVEAKVSGMSEAEMEQIIEKVVARIVEKLADSVLERVAWEVVPDLAENMIRAEIRKIKDAAA